MVPSLRRIACLAVACQVLTASAKLETGVAVLSSGTEGDAATSGAAAAAAWRFVGKFGYAVGVGTYDVRVRLREAAAEVATVDLEVFLDEDWDGLSELRPCRRALRARKTNILRASREWGPWTGGSLKQSVRSHIWYFALSSCASATWSNATVEVEYELRTRQFDESELSVELRHMPAVTALAMLCLSGFLARFAARCRRHRQSAGAVHPVVRALAAAVLLQWGAQALHLLHLVVHEAGGVGESLAEAVADILFMLSQVASTTLLLMIAQGYTLNPAKDVVFQKSKPVAAVVAGIHVLLVGHGRLQGEHAEKHHENEGVVGWTLVLVRLLLYVWFVAGVRAQRRSGGSRLHPFLSQFMVAGSAYFLAYPVIYAVVQLFAAYLQHPLLELGMAAMQTASAFWLSDLFLGRGMYYQVSTLGASLLPGGCSPSSSSSSSPASFKCD